MAKMKKKAARRPPGIAKPAKRKVKSRAKARRTLAAVTAANLVDIELEKSTSSPPLVRVTSPSVPGDVIPLNGRKGKIPGCTAGSFVSIDVDVTGNPGAVTTLSVKRATPASVVVTIPLGSGQASINQFLQVTG